LTAKKLHSTLKKKKKGLQRKRRGSDELSQERGQKGFLDGSEKRLGAFKGKKRYGRTGGRRGEKDPILGNTERGKKLRRDVYFTAVLEVGRIDAVPGEKEKKEKDVLSPMKEKKKK